MARTWIDSFYYIFGFYSLILILLGTPLNFFCFYIFKRLIPNRSNATIIVFSYLALIELLIPFTWNLNYVVRELFWKHRKTMTIKNLEQSSLFVCKFISFAAYFTLECAAWLKTLATFARFVSLRPRCALKNSFSKSKIVHRLSWTTIFLLAAINLPVFLINGKEEFVINSANVTIIEIRCYRSIFFRYWEIVHLLLYNFLPFTLMIVCNISISRHVRESRRRTQRSKFRSPSTSSFSNQRRSFSATSFGLTQTLIFVTVVFILFTSPSAIFYISLGKIIKRHRNLISMALSNLATTNHVSSFFIYWMTSADFRDAAMNFFFCRSTFNARSNAEKSVNPRTPFIPLSISSTTMQRSLPSD